MPIPVLKLLSNRFVLAFTFSKIFFDPVWYFYTFWFPEYLKQARHFGSGFGVGALVLGVAGG